MDTDRFMTELGPLLARLRDDLTERAAIPDIERALRAAHDELKREQRTAASYALWVDDRCTQVAAAWVLSMVFVRALEDRDLLDTRRIAGPGARDSQDQFYQLAPFLTGRDYLLTVFHELSRLPGARHVFDRRHNPVWVLGPSGFMADELLAFFRTPDNGQGLRYTFVRPDDPGDTRVLGDLYQDLFEDVRERYALFQTPDFVESFILDQTLEPAIETFGLQETTLIDPTCGSGHFLLGAYRRFFGHWLKIEPATRRELLAARALSQVAGADLNPYAVAIARFRLTLEFLRVARYDKLRHAPAMTLNVCVADSLLHGKGQRELGQIEGLDEHARERLDMGMFRLEDSKQAERVLGKRYTAVVGNPPYIAVADKAVSKEYRKRYVACHRGYQLVAPFMERFFDLAEQNGHVGAIVGNGFMKREFGSKLITEVLKHKNLTRVIDTSGAYIPGHGTPTVLLFGRNQPRSDAGVFAVLGNRGEPETPKDPARGLVWSSIAQHHNDIGFENDYITVAELPRERFDVHPWSLTGGGASELKEQLEQRGSTSLGELWEQCGRTAHTGEDSVFFVPPHIARSQQLPTVPLIKGAQVRDFALSEHEVSLFPYTEGLDALTPTGAMATHLWPLRTTLRKRRDFGQYIEERGLKWFEYSMFFEQRFRTPLSIAFPFVATHNHFVLDRGGKVFNRTAPIIKLPPEATEDEHLALLGYLNSSTVLFWLNQVCQPKHMGNASGANATPFLVRREFDSSKLEKLPIPPGLEQGEMRESILARATRLDTIGSALSLSQLRAALFDADFTNLAQFEQVKHNVLEERARLKRTAVWHQEMLDWLTYEAFGLVDAGFATRYTDLDAELELGERAFELRMARNEHPLLAEWAEWHLLQPRAELSESQPDRVRKFVEAAIRRTDDSRPLAILEHPSHKRRWLQPKGKAAKEPFTDELAVRDLVTEWLVDQVEAALITLQESKLRAYSITEIAASLKRDPKFLTISQFHTGDTTPDLEMLCAELVEAQAVPYLAAYRYTASGAKKRALWEETWALQRQEDAGTLAPGTDVPVPPKYKSSDFQQPVYWRMRGKLDVPKERFIAYPDASTEDDPSPVIGWAGWNHLEQAMALVELFRQRVDLARPERVKPQLAGLLELSPWLLQWHNEPDPAFAGQRPGERYQAFVSAQARKLGFSLDDIRAYQPPAATRPSKASKAESQTKTTGTRARKPKLTPEQLLAAVRALTADDPAAHTDLADLAEHLGTSKQTISKLAGTLVDQGDLVQVSARPKRFRPAD